MKKNTRYNFYWPNLSYIWYRIKIQKMLVLSCNMQYSVSKHMEWLLVNEFIQVLKMESKK